MTLWRTLFGHPSRRSDLSAADTVLNAIIAEAGLVSNTAAIDPLLDDVRFITAKLGPAGTPSHAQEETLVDIYLQIESYLTNRDPLRRFSRAELRQHLRPTLCRHIERREILHAHTHQPVCEDGRITTHERRNV